jgi:hypothetical protein
MRVDDGGRLLVDGDLILDGWRPQGPTLYTATVEHGGGALPVTMEYFERTGYVVAELSWQRIADLPEAAQPAPISTPPATEPPSVTETLPSDEATPSDEALIIDDDDPGFVVGNPSVEMNGVDNGYGSSALNALNHQTSDSNYAWGRWYPDLPGGRYEVFVFVPEVESSSGQATASARYWVVHSGQYTLRLVSQAANPGRWVSLGSYVFDGDQSEYVSLADVTGETTGSTLVFWDAVRWEPVE